MLLLRATTNPEQGRVALEDFTTEALAGAIRRQPETFLAAVARHVELGDHRASTPLTWTQRGFLRDGVQYRLDLILSWSRPSPLHLWFEVKVQAGISGAGQLSAYADLQADLTHDDGERRAPVILISASDLRTDAERASGIGWLPWQAIAESVARVGATADTLWVELTCFLEEIRMVDEMFPITAREATSLPDAFRLYRKSVRLVAEVNARALGRYPEVGPKGWWGSGAPEFVRKQFRDHGRFMLGAWGDSPIGLMWGLDPTADGEATYAVWLEADPRNSKVHSDLHAAAASADLFRDGMWKPLFNGWQIVEARAHTVTFANLDDSVAWFIDRFDDLHRAQLLELRRSFTRPPSGSREIDPDGAEIEDTGE
jgi:hypothetical protein